MWKGVLFLLLVFTCQSYILVGCNDPQVDIPACFLHLFDGDKNGFVTYNEWNTGVENLQVGRETAQEINPVDFFDMCDYTGDYELSIDDWTNRTWPCEISNVRVILFCALCQQNGWVPSK